MLSTSSPILPTTWQKREHLVPLVVIAVCCIAAMWTTLQDQSPLRDNLIITNSIGLSQYAISLLVRAFHRGRLPAWGILLFIPLGFVVGSKLASFTGVPDVAALMLQNPGAMRRPFLSALLIGLVVLAFFLYFSRSRGVAEALERERRRAAEALQAETAARLALLQAQIEPHFLFNTLANIQTLIRDEPDTAVLILEKLNAFLRTSLRRSRNASTTVDEELEIVEALLAIAAARLGPRLDYEISAAPELRAAMLPPLLLQPLVENAIRHGVEPAVAGGTIRVDVRKTGDALELTVTDTGAGLGSDAPEGVGLANVRARLASLYGPRGKLALYANTPRGLVAKLIVPTATA